MTLIPCATLPRPLVGAQPIKRPGRRALSPNWRIERSVIGLTTRIASSAPASANARRRSAIRSGGPSSAGTSSGRSPAARSSTTSTHTLRVDLAGVAAGRAGHLVDRPAELGEALRRVAALDVPGVPRVDVRQRGRQHPRAGGADHQRRPPRGRREQQRVLDGVEAPGERDALAGQQPADDLERLLEAREASGRTAGRTRGTRARSSRRRAPRRAARPRARRPRRPCGRGSPAAGRPCRRRAGRSSRARSRRPGRRAASTRPRVRARGARRRGRAGGRRSRSSRSRPPRRRAPSPRTRASARRARPRAAGPRPSHEEAQHDRDTGARDDRREPAPLQLRGPLGLPAGAPERVARRSRGRRGTEDVAERLHHRGRCDALRAGTSRGPVFLPDPAHS